MSQLVFRRSFRQINITHGGFSKRAYRAFAKEHRLKKATVPAEAARMRRYEAAAKRFSPERKAKLAAYAKKVFDRVRNPPKPKVRNASAAAKKAWATRKRKYGKSGGSGRGRRKR